MLELHELTHIILSTIVALVIYRYAKTGWVFVASFLGGFFLDVDHFYDYFKFRDAFVFNLKEFTDGKYFDLAHKVYIIFHGYEYAVVISIIAVILLKSGSITWKPRKVFAFCLLAFAISMFFHLVYDQVYYKPKILTYSIIYRASKHFDHDSLGFKKVYAK